MTSLGSSRSFLWALVLVLFAFICTGNSFEQQLWFYDAKNTSIEFNTHISDMAVFSLFLPQVTRYCIRGKWFTYSTEDFQTPKDNLGNSDLSSLICDTFTTAASVKSLRHLGASNSSIDALSLYTGEYFSKEEILVTAQAHKGITNKIFSVAGTGTADWMVFEGQDLDGKSKCYEVPYPGGQISYDPVSHLGLSTVGSVFKGCNFQQIQNYKMQQAS